MWTRESDMTQGFYRPVYACQLDGGVDASGKVTGVRDGVPVAVDRAVVEGDVVGSDSGRHSGADRRACSRMR